MNKKLRKQQNLLVDAGIGVILFAVWNVVKTNLYLGFSPIFIEEVYEAAKEAELNEKFFLAFFITFVVVILLWQLGIRMYIGLSAMAEGKGKTKGIAYLVLAAVSLLIDLQAAWQVFGIERILEDEGPSVDLITGLCMEAVSIYVLLELLISGIRVKKLRKNRKE